MFSCVEKNIQSKRAKNRIIELDFLRGFCILLMICDHLLYDAAYLMNRLFSIPVNSPFRDFMEFAQKYWNHDHRLITRLIVLAIFFLVSGVCCNLSRNNLKRSLILLGVGGAIDLGFLIFSLISKQADYMFFGTITCYGVSIFIFWLLKFILDKLKLPKNIFKWIVLGLGTIFIVLGIIFGGFKLNPDWIYELKFDNWFFVVIGKYGFGDDWLPLFPQIGFLFIGAFLGQTLYKNKQSIFKPLPSKPETEDKTIKKVGYYALICPFKAIKCSISFVGHYSLWFYIGHQIILVLILSIVCLATGSTFSFFG